MIKLDSDSRERRKNIIKEKQDLLASMKKRQNVLNMCYEPGPLLDNLNREIEAIQEEIDYLTEINKCLIGGIAIDTDQGTVLKNNDVTDIIDNQTDELGTSENIFVDKKF